MPLSKVDQLSIDRSIYGISIYFSQSLQRHLRATLKSEDWCPSPLFLSPAKGRDDRPPALHPVPGPDPLHPQALVQTSADPAAPEERQRRGGQRDPLHPVCADGGSGPREPAELPRPGAQLQRHPQHPGDAHSGRVRGGRAACRWRSQQ